MSRILSSKEWPKLFTIVVLIGIAIVALATFRDYGIGWDGRVQDVYGHKLLAYYLSDFRDRSAFTYSDLRYYGGFFDLLSAVVNAVSPFGEFETRHLLGAVIFIVGLVGAWRLTRLLAGDRAAFIAVLGLALTPALYGHAFINPKDSPFAWLLVWVTYFACRIVGERQNASAAVYLGFAITLGLALGTKVFAAAYLGYLLAFLVADAAIVWSKDKNANVAARTKPVLKSLLWALPVAFAIMTIFWPWVIQDPGNFASSIGKFLKFPHKVPVLWDGETLSSTNPPFSYLLVLLGLKLPEYVLVGLAAAVVAAARDLKRLGIGEVSHFRVQQFLYVILTALVPIAAFIVIRPTVYNGIRQYLFIVPPLVILAAIGLNRVLAFALSRGPVLGAAFGCLLAFAFVRQSWIMAGLHPYEYVAFNALDGDLAHAGREFELDYWGTSLAEAGRDLPKLIAGTGNRQPASSQAPRVFICGDKLSAEYFMPRSVQVTDKIDTADFFMAPDVAVCQNLVHRPARTVLEIKRDGAILARVLDLSLRAVAGGNLALQPPTVPLSKP